MAHSSIMSIWYQRAGVSRSCYLVKMQGLGKQSSYADTVVVVKPFIILANSAHSYIECATIIAYLKFLIKFFEYYN